MNSVITHYNIPIRMETELFDDLKEVSRKEERSVSEIVCDALSNFFREKEDALDD